MFENLSTGITNALDSLRRKRVISSNDVEEALKMVRLSLLESDVAFDLVEKLSSMVSIQLMGKEIGKEVDPVGVILRIIQEEIQEILSDGEGVSSELSFANIPSVMLMMGLQGAGKTTTTIKLAKHIQNKVRKKVLVVSLDVQRPAAQEQLEILAQKNNIDSLEIIQGQKPEKICKRAVSLAKKLGYEVVLLDSAGRLSIDEELLKELQSICKISSPVEKLLVLDSLTGQDAINTALNFSKQVGVTGVIMTKMDGDGKGGAALSMKHVIGAPIKFIGVGEKVDELDQFDAAKIASRIMDMGDIQTLIEKAEEVIGKDDIDKFGKKVVEGEFDLNDMLEQMNNMENLGGLGSIMKLIPGANKMKDMLKNSPLDPNTMSSKKAIILSMTKYERTYPEKLNTSRKRRIAKGSGVDIQTLNQMLKMYKNMKKMMLKGGKMKELMGDQDAANNMDESQFDIGKLDMGNIQSFMNKLK